MITSASKGGVWLGYDGWLYRWDGRTVTPLDLASSGSQPIKTITQAHTDSSGRLWLAYDLGKIGFLDANGAFHLIDSREGLAAGTQPFFEDRDHTLWVAGHLGVSRVANETVVTINRDNGLPANRVWSIVEDDEGYLWLSVDRGLLRVSRDEIAAVLANRAHRIQFTVYDTSDGLAGAPLGNIRSARGSDGRLWFVRGGGLTQVDPRRLGLITPPVSSTVRIEAAVANERRLTPDPRTALPAGTRRLQISYTTVALTASNKIHFRYRLDGFDTDWVDAGTRRQAFYTNLSPRSYRFRVEADTENGTWLASTAVWDFAIEPAFYQTTWFYAASFGMVVLIVAGAWRIRLRRVRREFSLVLVERARLSREIHDTLLQSLVGVALQFDAIANALDSSSSAARSTGAKPPACRGVHSRSAAVDLGSPVAGPRNPRPRRGAARVRQAGGDGHVGPVRCDRGGDAPPVLREGRESAAAHRSGGDYQRRAPRGRDADWPRTAVRGSDRHAPGLRRRPRLRSRVVSPNRRQSLRADDDAGACRGAWGAVHDRLGSRPRDRGRNGRTARRNAMNVGSVGTDDAR